MATRDNEKTMTPNVDVNAKQAYEAEGIQVDRLWVANGLPMHESTKKASVG